MQARSRHTVVLIHGLGRTPLSMALLGRRLSAAGFAVESFGYLAAAGRSVDRLAAALKDTVRQRVTTERYHLVGHSLGNIVVRAGFRDGYPPGLERIVMLAPPNCASSMAKLFGDKLLFRAFAGQAGQELADEVFYQDLPVPTVEFGVIAGTRGQRLTFDEPNDGIVAVAETRLEGMADFFEVEHVHTFIMNGRDVADAVVSFLETGRFAAEQGVGAPVDSKGAEAGPGLLP